MTVAKCLIGVCLFVLTAAPALAQSNPSTSLDTAGAPQSGAVYAIAYTALGCQASCIGKIQTAAYFINVPVSMCEKGFFSGGKCWSPLVNEPWPGFPSRAEATAKYINPTWGCYTGASNHYVTWPNQAPSNFANRTDQECYTRPLYGCENNSCLPNSPVVLRLDTGGPIKFSAPDTGFDIDNDGVVEIVSWPLGNVAFLALDRNGNGTIDNGSELFGDKTLPGQAEDGFAALRLLAETGSEGMLTSAFPLWSSLRLWHDRNRDGVSQADELETLDRYLEGISLAYTITDDTDRHGNTYRFKGWARYKRDSELHAIYDVFLAEKP